MVLEDGVMVVCWGIEGGNSEGVGKVWWGWFELWCGGCVAL